MASSSGSASSSSSSSSSAPQQGGWFSKLLLREFVNAQLQGAEPWKVVVGSIAGVVGAKVCYDLYHTKNPLQKLAGSALSTVRQLPGARTLVSSQTSKVIAEMEAGVTFSECGEPNLELPATPLPGDQLLEYLNRQIARESAKWRDGKVSGVVYYGDDEHTKLVNQAFILYSLSNPLHADLFPSLRKFESEVIAMTISMLGGKPSTHFGAVTSGGTESIIMALKCYRDQYRANRPDIAEPEIICCETAHAAFKKGCQYFGLKMVEVPVDSDHRMSLAATAAAINRNTILLVGSAPCYSSGIIDPIAELGRLALTRGLGLHVDGCLGGFIMPWLKRLNPSVPAFDFSVPGVTSMSADTHKYGFTVKGTSVLMFSSKELRDRMHFVDTDWPGGIYASPGMAGSRSGGLIAATWTSLMAMGQSRFMEVAEGIWHVVTTVKQGITAIPQLRLLGDSVSSVVAFTSDQLNIFRVGEGMSKRGWSLNNLQRPNAIHICVVAPMIGKADLFIQDLRQVVDEIVASPDAHAGGSAGIYGLATSIPDRSIIREIAAGYLDILTKPMTPVSHSSSSSSH